MQPVWVEEDEIRRNLPEEDFARLEGLWGVLSSMGEDGGVTKQQFLACQVAVRKSFPELLFDMFDTDRDGVIHRAEFLQGIFFCLTNAYQDIGKSCAALSPSASASANAHTHKSTNTHLSPQCSSWWWTARGMASCPATRSPSCGPPSKRR